VATSGGRRRGRVGFVAFSVLASAGLLAFLVTTVSSSSASPTPSDTSAPLPEAQTLMLQGATYTPKAPPGGGTDDYHCTLLDPRVTENSFIVASQFFPGSPEDHHAILFLVPPDLAAQARQADAGGQGWTCFGETPLPGSNITQISNTPWLTAWAPGHGQDVEPSGTGVPLAKGSLVVMQVHYNMLVGDAPVTNKLQLDLVPATTHLKALSLDLLPAPPDIPCPAGVSGPLCDRTASLADLARRTGASQAQFVSLLESICGRSPIDPPAGDSTSCSWAIPPGTIYRVTAHMHLLGRTMKVVLNPGTPDAKTLLDVPNYNFDYQKSYNLSTPVTAPPGSRVQVTCTFDPTLRQKLPQLRQLPPRFVTWGDGSSDEMCLALLQYVGPKPVL
jgi:hypothetical protein